MTQEFIQSFEVTEGGVSGDMLSTRRGDRKLVVGLLACGYFEYWRMYPNLREQVEGDTKRIAAKLGRNHPVVYPGLVDTLDRADAAGKYFTDKQIDLLVITEGTYCPDYMIHQALFHLPGDLPICLYASQAHDRLDYNAGYDVALRNSGPMGLIQLSAGFRKMDKYKNFEVVSGGIEDEEAYAQIDRFIRVRTTISNLKHWNVGLVGHVFRGMYDFQYDKTAVSGKLGPHVIDIDIKHLATILDSISEKDSRIFALRDKVRSDYAVIGLEDGDILRSARLSIALEELVQRYRLDGLVLLGQHFIEQRANATCYLGLTQMLERDQALAVTEGDVLGLIMSKVLKDFSGHTPFFGEWEEIDVGLNAMMLLGHGFVDPREARKDRKVQAQPACENWGFEGNSLGLEATYETGPVTMTHIIQDARGWRILISEGEILDTPPLKINETSLIVKVNKDVRRYMKELIKLGFPHHCIVSPGRMSDDLEVFADQLEIEICRL
jgi:L-arabinose isomerase